MMKCVMLTVLCILFNSLAPDTKGQSLLSGNSTGKKLKYDFSADRIFIDSNKIVSSKNKVQKLNIGGIFISPNIGVAFPTGVFGDYSNAGLLYGAKVELAYSRLYPFIFGFVYEKHENYGNADFTTANSLTFFETKITYIGGSVDIILNKFIKSDFTIPVFSAEIKYATANRTISPATSLPEIEREKSILTYSAGLAFTIYVFDINSRYTFGDDLSTLSFQLRFHIPVVKF